MARDLTGRFREVVRESARCRSTSDEGVGSSPARPAPSSARLARAALLYRGIRSCEETLRRVAVAYATPGGAGSAMSDETRNGIEAQVNALLVECRASLSGWRGGGGGGGEARPAGGGEGSFAAHERGGVEVAVARTVELSALFHDLQKVRCRRELRARQRLAFPPAAAPWPPEAGPAIHVQGLLQLAEGRDSLLLCLRLLEQA